MIEGVLGLVVHILVSDCLWNRSFHKLLAFLTQYLQITCLKLPTIHFDTPLYVPDRFTALTDCIHTLQNMTKKPET